jgi:hypothetical protein
MPSRLTILGAQWLFYGLLASRLESDYSYDRIAFHFPTLGKLLFSLVCLALVARLLPSATAKPSDIALWLTASFVVVPTLSVGAVNPLFSHEVKVLSAAVVLSGFVTTALVTRARPSFGKLLATRNPALDVYLKAVVAATILAIGTIIYGFGIRSINLRLSGEYERRLIARTLDPPYPGAFYVVSWLKAVLVPLLLILGLRLRRPLLIIVSMVGVVAIFSFSGEKAAFVYPAVAGVALASVVLARRGKSVPWLGVLLTLGALILPLLVSYFVSGWRLDVLISRRFGLVPGIHSHNYVEYAERAGFTNFQQSFFRVINSSADTRSTGIRVGQWLDPSGSLNANAHLWADGYLSGGLLGVLFVSLLLAIVLRAYDALARSRDSLIAVSALGTVTFVYVNGYFHTSVMTDGIAVMWLLIWLLPSLRDSGVVRRVAGRPSISVPTASVTRTPFGHST